MALRLGRLVGAAAILLVFARLGRVLHPPLEGPDWRLVGLVSVVVGGLVTWMVLSYRVSGPKVAIVSGAAILVLVMRVAAGPTLRLGLVPGPDTASVLAAEIGQAIELLRFGAPPVLASAGLSALVAAGMWLLGGLWAAGVVSQRAGLGIAPALGFYLYLAVMDRQEAGIGWMAAFAALAALGLVATHVVTRPGTGRLRDEHDRLAPRREVAATAIMVGLVCVAALGGATAFAGTVPATGRLDWRTSSGLGPGLGAGQALNLFIGLRQDLVSQSDEPVFVARVAGDTDGESLYWKLITLDNYDGSFWTPGSLSYYEPGRWENPEMSYRGPTRTVEQVVRIESLRQDFLPALYSPVGVSSTSQLVASGLSVRDDGSLHVAGRTFEGLTYQVTSEVPLTDVAALASVGGELSPIFDGAATEGVFDVEPQADPATAPERPELISTYLELPDEIDPAVRRMAFEAVSRASTAFERALLLESFFRDGDRFTYSTSVSTGHSTLDMADWLTDPESPNYRTGYCEQFATTMAVMGRLLGLPTRAVIGFTPGETVTEDDGNELIVVRQRNAHAWVEVWFDSEGWVRFDPTPRGDGVNPPTVAAVGFDPVEFVPPAATLDPFDPFLEGLGFLDGLAPFNEPLPSTTSIPAPAGRIPPIGVVALVVVAAAGALPLFKALRRRRRLARVRRGDVTAAWADIVDRLTDLGVPPGSGATPLEYAATHGKGILPLAHAYSATIYGSRRIGDAQGLWQEADRWIHVTHDGSSRVRASFSPRSLRGTRR